MELFGEWARAQGLGPESYHDPAMAPARKRAGQRALNDIKALHSTNPKYSFAEESQQAVIEECGVDVLNVGGTYVRGLDNRRVRLLDGREMVSVEEFVRRHLERQGYSVIPLESRPFHVLFGIYMWLLIEDPVDPQGRMIAFGDRTAFDLGLPSELIWMRLPEDFGTTAYVNRRSTEIDRHLAPDFPDELEWLFDYWLDGSKEFRQYLWAHRPEDVETARQLVHVLPADMICDILRYLVSNYWGRYLGWPDLLAYRGSEVLFVEAKSSRDRLSDDQKAWIRGNSERLGLPFAIVKVHRKATVDLA